MVEPLYLWWPPSGIISHLHPKPVHTHRPHSHRFAPLFLFPFHFLLIPLVPYLNHSIVITDFSQFPSKAPWGQDDQWLMHLCNFNSCHRMSSRKMGDITWLNIRNRLMDFQEETKHANFWNPRVWWGDSPAASVSAYWWVLSNTSRGRNLLACQVSKTFP